MIVLLYFLLGLSLTALLCIVVKILRIDNPNLFRKYVKTKDFTETMVNHSRHTRKVERKLDALIEHLNLELAEDSITFQKKK